MSYELEDCLKRKKLYQFPTAKKLVQKELKAAEDDLKDAKESLSRDSYKWATTQGYYAMFHAARGLVYSLGYREKSHYCLEVALEAFFVEKGLLEKEIVDSFGMARDLRENADYRTDFSKEGAEEVILYRSAEILIQKASNLLKAK